MSNTETTHQLLLHSLIKYQSGSGKKNTDSFTSGFIGNWLKSSDGDADKSMFKLF